jgi:hypothetical protein
MKIVKLLYSSMLTLTIPKTTLIKFSFVRLIWILLAYSTQLIISKMTAIKCLFGWRKPEPENFQPESRTQFMEVMTLT